MIYFDIADEADQKFATTLNGRRVSIRLRYNPTVDRWSFDLSLDGVAVLHGHRIVKGVDLLAAYNFGIGVLFAASDSEGDPEPNRGNLPLGLVKIFHATQEEVNAAMAS